MPFGAPDRLSPPVLLAAMFPVVFGPPPLTTAPFYQLLAPVAPDRLTLPPARAAYMPYLFRPSKQAVPSVAQPIQPVEPWRVFGAPTRAAYMPYLFRPGTFVTPVAPAIPGVGVAGAATFVLSLEAGTKVTYSWSTDVMLSYSGLEQRTSTYGSPNRRIEGNAFVLDEADRDVKAALVRSAASGATFLVALTFEAAQISAASPNSALTVASTAALDWAITGQRIVISGTNGVTQRAIVQSTTSTTIAVVLCDANWNFAFGALGATGAAGGLVSPCVQVLLDAAQGFARYTSRVDLWGLRVRANAYGWAGVDSMGIGTTVTTLGDALPVPVAKLTDDSLLIWDRVNEIAGTGNESMLARTDVVDLGALPFAIGGNTVPAWQRPIRLRSSSQDDWQWLKAFTRHCRGMQGAFLLPTHRPDLVPLGMGGGGLLVQSASVVGGGDYTAWFASQAHQRLAVTTTDGAVAYVTVMTVLDNGDGTLTLGIDTLVTGTISMISFLEMVRLDSDDVAVTWDGPTFTAQLSAVTVQDTAPLPDPWFDTQISPVFVVGANVEVTGVFGPNTVINASFVNLIPQVSSGVIGAITATGGNVDGMVVMIPCHLSPSNNQTISVAHNDTSFAATSRLLLPGLGNVSTQADGALLCVYNGTIGRWLLIGAA
jgi:hypothetical protein